VHTEGTRFAEGRVNMRLFTCSKCQQTVFFENVRCTSCGSTLAYLPDCRIVSSIEPVEAEAAGETERAEAAPQLFTALAPIAKEARYRLCANSIEFDVCNWAVREADDNPYCEGCRLNEVIPNLSASDEALGSWRRLEISKRRLFYTLYELGLPIESRSERPDNGLVFQFKEDMAGVKVFTGHNDGVITINIAEADDPFREKLRKDLREGYRTVLGHFRHEIGHYYWDRLIKDTEWIAAYRALFGDERASYEESLKRHYESGPPRDWPERFVSSYATMHPWEDWAETWAHYLHMIDTLGTARSYGLVLQPRPVLGNERKPLRTRSIDFDDFDDLMRTWVPITVALNSLNRSMGLNDPYPFVLMPKVVEKLRFVHDVVEHWDSADERNAIIERWLELAPPEPAAAAAASPEHHQDSVQQMSPKTTTKEPNDMPAAASVAAPPPPNEGPPEAASPDDVPVDALSATQPGPQDPPPVQEPPPPVQDPPFQDPPLRDPPPAPVQDPPPPPPAMEKTTAARLPFMDTQPS
jgi:hypothetical protein